jgi:hypothetical protein
VKATFTEAKYMSANSHPHPYGIVVGGNDLGTPQQSYLYCSAYERLRRAFFDGATRQGDDAHVRSDLCASLAPLAEYRLDNVSKTAGESGGIARTPEDVRTALRR